MILQQSHLDQHNIHRDSQSLRVHFIYRMWTKILRPLWNDRNKYVHALCPDSISARLLSDLRTEIIEIYSSTQIDQLHHRDRYLFDSPIDDILARSYSQLMAWRDSVEIAIASAARSHTQHEPNQTTIGPALPPTIAKPRQSPPKQPLPTPVNSPHLTPV